MKALSSTQVLQENHTTDPDAVISLTFTHRALSDVSCLAQFKKLERLDLTFNNLSSLEGLKPCLNLKWLSVKQNKLRSLKGVEGLACLTVLNAGSNMLQSMEEVKSLVRLRALILNDNEIVSICRTDQMKELNTLVLSRNPIRKIGENLSKANSITKLSLSNCKIECIGSSIKSCTELRELRLAHNEIRTLPSELARSTKIQNLDLGNNLIMRWSDLKILSSLANLKNLNLVGNPVAEKDVLSKKIKKLVPSIQIFNAKPIDKVTKNVIDDNPSTNASVDIAMKKEKTKKPKLNNKNASDDEENTHSTDPNSEKKSKRKSRDLKDGFVTEKETIKRSKKAIHDEETVHLENNENRNEKREEGDTIEKKKKRVKSKARGSSAVQLLSPEAEFGLGGPSAWDLE
ncbi:protein phosphatase 1 regulatory inhibitor subunit PPP1R7 homolog isoform X1 [Cynara cardunculus var. scolymus]|uniref:protein phosphatase 1 regulatory inhibitor subunit PPP1R7 homolog isoform X1 n=1 Tax=Cynara cardunculus var. scolymus TaxID=59895 RepID=UPI000D625056|nr:protein phosphatase 1 regulatory inhibitor subunit PPP1R7 homolog isoform X1 [Cynara cardunculus var. scolymus]